MDLAMTLEGSGSKPEVLLEEYGFTADELQEFSAEPLFAKRVDHFRKQLQERGFTFRTKAQYQAELLLDNSWDIIHDQETSPAVKADLIKWTAKMANFEPTKDSGGTDGGVKINIFMGEPNDPPITIRTTDNE